MVLFKKMYLCHKEYQQYNNITIHYEKNIIVLYAYGCDYAGHRLQ